MSKLLTNFGIAGVMTGQSDPVAIKISDWALEVDNPSVTSGSKATISGTPYVVFPKTGIGGQDMYVYVRNTGVGGNMTPNAAAQCVVQIEHLSGNNVNVAELNVGDHFFAPVIKDTGITVTYAGSAVTNFVFAYFKRS